MVGFDCFIRSITLALSGTQDLAEAVEVGLDPARPIDHQHRSRTAAGLQPRDIADIRSQPGWR